MLAFLVAAWSLLVFLFMMEPREFTECVLLHTKVGRVESDPDLDLTFRLASVIDDLLHVKYNKLLRENMHRPVLVAYMSDGWSSRVSSRNKVRHGDHCMVRHNNVRLECVLERVVLRTPSADGQSNIAMLLGPPRGLAAGKLAWSFFTAACEFVSSPRIVGHEGIIINVVIQDGMLYEPLLRTMRSIRGLYYDTEGGVDQGDEHVLRQLTEWTVGLKCKSHCCHNAFVWALKRWDADKVGDDCHIVIASLRNCAQALHSHIDLVITRCVKFETKEAPRGELVAFLTFFQHR